MAGRYCKAILNGVVRAISEALEEILADRMLPATGKITEAQVVKLLDQLVLIDLDAVDGGQRASMSLLQIVAELVRVGVVTEEVWYVLAKPGN